MAAITYHESLPFELGEKGHLHMMMRPSSFTADELRGGVDLNRGPALGIVVTVGGGTGHWRVDCSEEFQRVLEEATNQLKEGGGEDG